MLPPIMRLVWMLPCLYNAVGIRADVYTATWENAVLFTAVGGSCLHIADRVDAALFIAVDVDADHIYCS